MNLTLGENRESRECFIATMPSSLYTGTNAYGEKVVILSQQNDGMTIKTVRKSKPKWYECVEYGKDGEQVAVWYDRRGE
jgi:hypothetical protein